MLGGLRGLRGVAGHATPPARSRAFITLPDFSSTSPPATYTEERLLPYAQRDLWRMVADVGRYSEFVPHCTHSRVLGSGEREREREREREWKQNQEQDAKLSTTTTVEAELGVGFKGFEERYTSVVTLQPFHTVTARASSQTPLFKSLETRYRFTQHSHTHTLLAIELEYAFSNPLYAALSSTFFDGVSHAMVNAFEERARVVCGRV
ncbi:hypothetical protein E3P77_00877 [Wallemia ichthyophaga]|nr:hypothetical protein E3P77_00877 [Wallemia ichthyophaga]